MEVYQIILIALAAVIILAFSALTVLAVVCDVKVFGARFDKVKGVRYFTPEDFNLSSEPVTLSGGLRGYLYKADVLNNGNLVIFCHGMGPGHVAYMTEIAYFCRLGYTVLAVDSKGCNYSAGMSVGGMYSGVKTAVAAIDYAGMRYVKIYLVGHSWGAYSALCASKERKVDGVVAISGFTTPASVISDGLGRAASKPVGKILKPFFWLINLFKYGVKGNRNAAHCAKANGCKTLIVHSDNDNVVEPSSSVYYKIKSNAVTKLLVPDRAHNPYNTETAVKKLAELSALISSGQSIEDFDFVAATEEDEEVMKKIADFLAD